VKKVGQKEGKTIQIGNARLTWKAMGVDTAYGTSLYAMVSDRGVNQIVHQFLTPATSGLMPPCQ
jgi:hypothetical protein